MAYNCRYYLGDRPCVWHKKEGVLCECGHYAPLTGNLLIIKLDAMGDVLRTTCLLPMMARKWPGARVTWVTRQESVPLLEHNPYVTDIIPYGPDAITQLASRRFDRVVNLDAGRISSALGAMAKADEKVGYVLHEDGYVTATNPAAEVWLELGVFDDLKRANERTYQEIMCSILGLSADGMRYVLELTGVEKERGRAHLCQLGLDLGKAIIGIHTGAGGRWPQKQWGEGRLRELIESLMGERSDDFQILLLGGPSEREMNRRIMGGVTGPIFDGGCDNELRHFAALVRCCSVVMSGDSLAMHVALAMGRRTVVLFGPTSHTEIELFGLGEKVFADLDCLGCYRTQCTVSPNCMDLISVGAVKEAILRQLAEVVG